MKYLITGGCGFLGSNLAQKVLKQGEELYILDNLSREGSDLNLQWLKTLGTFEFAKADIRNQEIVFETIKKIKPDVIFHLAGQVAMTTSLENPFADFEINVKGSLNVLEAVRKYCPDCIILYSSTNKVYGDIEEINYDETNTRYIPKDKQYSRGFDESLPLAFSTPYGCSKGAADQYMIDYCKMFNIKTAVFRHSSMYGSRQFATINQGWISWFAQKAIETKKNKNIEPFSISGSGKQVRDVLFSDDLVSLYFQSIKNIENIKGQAFNIGGGIKNSLSLLELFGLLESKLDIKLNYNQLPVRQSDQKFFVADITKAQNLIGWTPLKNKEDGIQHLLEWVERF